MRRISLKSLAILGAVLLAAPAFAQSPGKAPPTVRDLAWGEVLFNHYQQDQMGALVRLEMAEARDELPYHGGEARLLRGGLYLAWGLRDEAAEIFDALLASGAPPDQRDQVRYWLARIYHERGEHGRAALAIDQIEGHLPAAMAADRVDLEGRVLLALGRHAEAAEMLAASRQPGAWRPFADFNHAVALARSGRTAEALPLLDRLGRSRGGNEELAMLRDRANLALGLARLDAGDPDGARVALDRVRLEGAYAARALLAAGWAEAGRERYRAALGPWTRLAQLPDADGASLEAMLAVSWAWHQADEPGESVLGYQRAVAACEAELESLGQAAAAARGDALLAMVTPDARMGAGADIERARPEGALATYLHALAVDHPFRAIAADLGDLHQLRENLLEWRRSLGALRDMVEARRARFEGIAPTAEQRLALDEVGEFEARYEQVAQRVAAARAANDPAVLATPRERRLLQRLTAIEQRAAALPEGPERAAIEHRVRRLQGALAWQLSHEWPARIHATERDLRQARRELETARAAHDSLAMSLADATAGFEGFDARIDAAAARVDRLLARVETDHGRRLDELQAVALKELGGREQRVAAYLGQARFALAAAYDQAAQPRASRGDAAQPGAGTAP